MCISFQPCADYTPPSCLAAPARVVPAAPPAPHSLPAESRTVRLEQIAERSKLPLDGAEKSLSVEPGGLA